MVTVLLDEENEPAKVVRQIVVTPEDPDSDRTIHQWANARTLYPNGADDNYAFRPFQRVSNVAFTDPELPPPGITLTGNRAAWWKYPATYDGELQLSVEGEGGPLLLTVYEVLNNAWTTIGSAVASNTANLLTPMHSGRTYYARVSLTGTENVARYYQFSGHAAPGTTAPGQVTAPAPPIVIDVDTPAVTSTEPTDQSQHQWPHAVEIVPHFEDGSFSASVYNGSFTATEQAPPADDPSLNGFKAAWYYIDITWTGELTFQGSGDSNLVTVTAFDGTTQPWERLADSYGGSGSTFSVYYGERVYFRIGNLSSDLAQTVTLEGTAPIQAVDGIIVPAITVEVGTAQPTVHVSRASAPPVVVAVDTARPHVAGDVEVAETPPITVDVIIPLPSTPTAPLDVVAMTIGAGIIPPDLRRIRYGIIDPPDVTVIPSTTPVLSGYVNVFEGDVDNPGEISAEFEYGVGTGDSYMKLGSVIEPVEIYTSYTLVEAQLPALTPGTIYYWRMRVIVDGQPRAYSVWWSFGIGDTEDVEATLPVTATVTAGPTHPHLWFVDPPVGAPGEIVTLVGYGFPADETGVTFGSDTLQIVAWDHIPAQAAAGTPDRLIVDGQVDPAHDEIQVVIPDTEEPGAAITVLGEDD